MTFYEALTTAQTIAQHAKMELNTVSYRLVDGMFIAYYGDDNGYSYVDLRQGVILIDLLSELRGNYSVRTDEESENDG